jgi:hypothetical protein
MRVLQEMQEPVATGELYAGITMNVEKSQWLLWDLYAGIATNEECQRFLVTYMRVLKGMQNASDYYKTHMWVLQEM